MCFGRAVIKIIMKGHKKLNLKIINNIKDGMILCYYMCYYSTMI